MSENLKVNAKTQILEFKRKHNKIVDELPVNAQSGSISSVLGLDSNGKLVKGTISGGTKLYKHYFRGIKIGTHTNMAITIISLSGNKILGDGAASLSSEDIMNVIIPAFGPLFNYLSQTDAYKFSIYHIVGGSTPSIEILTLDLAGGTETVTPL